MQTRQPFVLRGKLIYQMKGLEELDRLVQSPSPYDKRPLSYER